MINLDKLKQFINHPERCVRNYAVEFFVEGHIADEEVILRVINAYTADHDREEAGKFLYYASKFPQTEVTLKRLDKIEHTDLNTMFHKDNAITHADLKLLKQYPDIRPRFLENQKTLEERFYLVDLNTERLWEELWKHSRSGLGKWPDSFNHSYGELIVKELAARKDFPYKKLKEKLEHEYPPEYNGWDDTYLSSLVGEMRLAEAIPFLISRLKLDGDYLCERAAGALSKIGSPEVVAAIEREYLSQGFDFRMYAASALGDIKSDEAEKLMLALFPEEKDITLKTNLALGLCKLLSVKGIPLVLDLIKRGYDKTMVNLEAELYVNHVINEIDHPDLQRWRESILEEEHRIKEAQKGNISLEQLKNRLLGVKQQVEKNKKAEKVGRNDPCPCGSGKKFKKCCGK
ncbi:MAG: hypothetical protein HPY50_09855 [Firmicutes bacterium]|nr:hypothetical protein [Bacillota bacterium]